MNGGAFARKRVGVRRTLTLLGFPAFAAAAAAAIAACAGTSPTTGITPITGVVIRSESLIAGHGCGRAPNQVYKYLAVVSNTDPSFPSGGAPPPSYAQVFDCFADGAFVNLLASPSGSLSFNVDIFVYNADDYAAHLADVNALLAPNAAPQIDPDAGTIPNAPPATWTTKCTATQQQNVVVLAVCQPLAGGPSPSSDGGAADGGSDGSVEASAGNTLIQLSTQSFARADGGTYACGADFVTTRGFYVGGGTMGQTGSTLCPQPLIIGPAVANVKYTLSVVLEKNGASVAQPTCTATTVSGQTVTATCTPAP